MSFVSRRLILGFMACFVTGAPRAGADEGMWTFDNLPTQQLKKRYGFVPSKQWLDHIQLATVRFNDGGTGSFVSPGGLVLTNHHVARGQLQKLSTPERDYVESGFLAGSRAEELRCPDLELNVLVSMENVTARVQGAVKSGMTDKEAMEARRAARGKIEKESLDATGLRSDVVTLYGGGEYWLYRYKKYTDVRVVFAPESGIAFFGGYPDNFTFPRYDLDMAFFRAYEDGQPIKSPDHLKWNPSGASDEELVFVAGHPGSTERLRTMAELEFLRDYSHLLRLETVQRRLAAAMRYASGGPEQARQSGNVILYAQNSIKVLTGQYQGLKDARLMVEKAAEEERFRRSVGGNPEWEKQWGRSWDDIAAAERMAIERVLPYLHRRLGGYRLPNLAIMVVRYVTEVKKPDGARLEEFHDSQLDSLRLRLLSPAPIYPGLEEALLADGLQLSLEKLGPDDPFVRAALNGRRPGDVAHEVISGTKLTDPRVRQQLIEGGEAAVAASSDSLIAFVRRLDPFLREMRKWHEDKVESVEISAHEKIAAARFAVYGRSTYPDATSTLRLTYGTVKGYPMNGTTAPPRTTFYGLYDRSESFDGKPPFNLPARWSERKDDLNLSTPFNYVTTCDVTGGNSGSPVVNRAGEIVGLIFDGNIESLVGDWVFDDRANRSVAVHTAGMTEALRKIYDAEGILRELGLLVK